MEPIVLSNYRVINDVEMVDVIRNDRKTNYTLFVVDKCVFLETGERALPYLENMALEHIEPYAETKRALAFQKLIEKDSTHGLR